MPTPTRVTARIAQDGQACTLRRPVGVAPSQTFTDVAVVAFVRGFRPSDLVGGLRQGDREARISDLAIAAAGWPGPPRINDKLVIDGRTCNVEAVETRRIGEAVAMHVLTVRG